MRISLYVRCIGVKHIESPIDFTHIQCTYRQIRLFKKLPLRESLKHNTFARTCTYSCKLYMYSIRAQKRKHYSYIQCNTNTYSSKWCLVFRPFEWFSSWRHVRLSIFSRDILVSGDFIISVSDATHADDRLQVPTSDDIKRRSDVNGVRDTCQQHVRTSGRRCDIVWVWQVYFYSFLVDFVSTGHNLFIQTYLKFQHCLYMYTVYTCIMYM